MLNPEHQSVAEHEYSNQARAVRKLKLPRLARIIFPVCVLSIMVFFFSFDAGKVAMDSLEKIGTQISLGMGLAACWTIRSVLRNVESIRVRAITLTTVALLMLVPITTGFSFGKDAEYPPNSRALVRSIQVHAREVKAIKEQIGNMRDSFTKPEQIVATEPLVTSLGEQMNQISQLDDQIMHDHLPRYVAGVLELMEQEMVFDKRQVQNIKEQIAIVRAVKDVTPPTRAVLYRRRLKPLMDQEQEIERQRQASNYEQRLKELTEQSTGK